MKLEYVIKPYPFIHTIMFMAQQVSIKWWKKNIIVIMW